MTDQPTILVTFARPEESRPFHGRLTECRHIQRGNAGFELGKLGPAQVAVAHTGIGPEAAAAAMNRLLPAAPWTHLIAAGFAGGLDPQLPLATVIIENRPSPDRPRLVSRPAPIESVEEKARIFHETDAAAVDMETDTLAAACQAAGLPFTAVRAISDPAATALPIPFAIWFDQKRQRPRPLSLLAFLLRHPRCILPFIRFLRTLTPVAKSLADAVVQTIQHNSSPVRP